MSLLTYLFCISTFWAVLMINVFWEFCPQNKNISYFHWIIDCLIWRSRQVYHQRCSHSLDCDRHNLMETWLQWWLDKMMMVKMLEEREDTDTDISEHTETSLHTETVLDMVIQETDIYQHWLTELSSLSEWWCDALLNNITSN